MLKDGKAAIEWPGVMQQPVYARVDRALEALCKANGAVYVKNPLSETVMGAKPATAHPLGGAGMGVDAGRGTIDHKGRPFTGEGGRVHDGLYVTDGAAIPRSLGCNPLFTITALAERCLALMALDYQLRYETGPSPALATAVHSAP